MGCDRVELGNGDFVIACSRGVRRPRCQEVGCSNPSAAQCDYPVKRRAPASQTCDRRMCARHRRPQPEFSNTDFCPTHDRMVNG